MIFRQSKCLIWSPFSSQVIELETVPQGVTPLILKYGTEIEMPFDGTPQKSGGQVTDPVDKNEYWIKFTAEGGDEMSSTRITIAKKIWFDGEIINGE